MEKLVENIKFFDWIIVNEDVQKRLDGFVLLETPLLVVGFNEVNEEGRGFIVMDGEYQYRFAHSYGINLKVM
ncbi:MAG: hypothetical protein Q8934_19045 [Bacillota bacterium]|nr:hypothetical protein [Bacillota bacterium]